MGCIRLLEIFTPEFWAMLKRKSLGMHKSNALQIRIWLARFRAAVATPKGLCIRGAAFGATFVFGAIIDCL